jgi:hypothetical protein
VIAMALIVTLLAVPLGIVVGFRPRQGEPKKGVTP